MSRSLLVVIPYGTDQADETFDFRLVGWRRIGDLWVPAVLYEATATLGTMTGVSGEKVTDSHLLADTLSASHNPGDPVTSSPADNTPAFAVVDAQGFERVAVQFKTGTAASAGALISEM